MEPIPPECGQMKFCIRRVTNFINKLAPSYQMYIEKKDGGQINILNGKKFAMKKTSYYQITLDKDRLLSKNEKENTLGKLRAVDGLKNQYVLFNNGDNFVNPGFDKQNLRREFGSFTYRYEPCNIGNIRKMVVIFPSVNY